MEEPVYRSVSCERSVAEVVVGQCAPSAAGAALAALSRCGMVVLDVVYAEASNELVCVVPDSVAESAVDVLRRSGMAAARRRDESVRLRVSGFGLCPGARSIAVISQALAAVSVPFRLLNIDPRQITGLVPQTASAMAEAAVLARLGIVRADIDDAPLLGVAPLYPAELSVLVHDPLVPGLQVAG